MLLSEPAAVSTDDYEQYTPLSSVYLSLNGRHAAANASKYAARCELFIQNEHKILFSNEQPLDSGHKCSELGHNLSHMSQTEFQQIIMWSDEFPGELKQKTNDINQLIEILSFKIQPRGKID